MQGGLEAGGRSEKRKTKENLWNGWEEGIESRVRVLGGGGVKAIQGGTWEGVCYGCVSVLGRTRIAVAVCVRGETIKCVNIRICNIVDS